MADLATIPDPQRQPPRARPPGALTAMTEQPKRYEFRAVRGGQMRRREFNGAGDLVHESLVLANALTGGLIDRLSGGRVTGPCAGCEKGREALNRALPL